MKIILVSVGTRGDMEPFVAIGELLKACELVCFSEIDRSIKGEIQGS